MIRKEMLLVRYGKCVAATESGQNKGHQIHTITNRVDPIKPSRLHVSNLDLYSLTDFIYLHIYIL